MTEQTLDALRPLAVVIEDEGSRLRRSLKGSSASEEQVREHLRNCLGACHAANVILNPLPAVIEWVDIAAVDSREVENFAAPAEKPTRKHRGK